MSWVCKYNTPKKESFQSHLFKGGQKKAESEVIVALAKFKLINTYRATTTTENLPCLWIQFLLRITVVTRQQETWRWKLISIISWVACKVKRHHCWHPSFQTDLLVSLGRKSWAELPGKSLAGGYNVPHFLWQCSGGHYSISQSQLTSIVTNRKKGKSHVPLQEQDKYLPSLAFRH